MRDGIARNERQARSFLNRTLREKGVRVVACATLRLARSSSYAAPTRHTSATLDFKEWRRVFVFLPRFLPTSLCRSRLALTSLT